MHVHRSERADELAYALAGLLREPAAGADPFTPEVVAVPARGVERWLTQSLSRELGTAAGRADGVCANLRFPSPGGLVDEALSAAAGIDPREDVWLPDRLVWPLLEVIDGCAGEAWCDVLGRHLGAAGPAGDRHRRGRRYAVARHLAGLFASYAAARPRMVQDWAGGLDTDGSGTPLPADLAWEAELWRRLRAHVGVPGPAERLPSACELLRAEPGTLPWPARLSVFGPTRLSASALAVLAAVAEHRDVHLWLPHPSPALWRSVGPLVPVADRRRAADPTAHLARNPLLASLGRDARELQLALAAAPGAVLHSDHPAPAAPGTLLGRLQAALRDDAALPPAAGRVALPANDRSVQVHACHGPARQVEVLREVLLGLLAADPRLEPRDILVMCPDVEAYAPLVSAAFGLGEATGATAGAADGSAAPGLDHPAHGLRVRLADRSLRQTNPLLAVLAAVLELADSRLPASRVLDLAALPPVRRRFALDDDDLERLQDWVARSGVRWGLDADSRRPFALGGFGQNTWRAGLDRVLLGAAMAEEGAASAVGTATPTPRSSWLGLALPLDDVDSSDIDLAGRLAELVDRLAVVLGSLTGEQPLAAWLDALRAALDALADVRDADSWQLAQARAELAEVGTAGTAARGEVRLTLPEVRALLARRLRGRPTRANFRTGTLTVCTLVPMRSVPHRVVALLGLDDGVFPRNATPDGDDILLRDPWVGERDPRSEDRQLLLDAVLAATEHLVVAYSGADERTNSPRPPAVPLGELLDAVDALAVAPDGGPARGHVLVRHPLQPFDPRNFTPAGLGAPGPFSFDRTALGGALAAAGGRVPPRPFLPQPLPDRPAEPVLALDALVRLLEHPVRAFLQQRLQVGVPGSDDEPSDVLAVELEPLERWAVGERLLRDRLAGASPERCRQAEWRRGTLPPGPLGGRALEAVLGSVEPLVRAAEAARAGAPAQTVDLVAAVPASSGARPGATATRVEGTVGDVHGDTVVSVTYSRLAAKHRLRAWASLVALTVAHPGTRWRAVTIGRGYGDRPRCSTLGPLRPEDASIVLGQLVSLHAAGMREPLPMAVKTSAAYADVRERGEDTDLALGRAREEWLGNDTVPGEAEDAAHRMVWGAWTGLDVLQQAGLADGAAAEPTRFGALARRLWAPLLAAEQVELL
nr:exodeoxyribonuclease V subunit gamma [Motilibacter aurantiacus]